MRGVYLVNSGFLPMCEMCEAPKKEPNKRPRMHEPPRESEISRPFDAVDAVSPLPPPADQHSAPPPPRVRVRRAWRRTIVPSYAMGSSSCAQL